MALVTAYVAVWMASLVAALRAPSQETLGPAGHGMVEGAVMVLIGISQPLGLLASTILSSAPSGRAGLVLLWCIAGSLGALQWVGIAAVARAIWRQFRPGPRSLRLR